MNNIIEAAMKLPKEEKIKLYHALQEELEMDDELHEDDLTPEQWEELKRREQLIKEGKVKWLSRKDLNNFLRERRNALQNNNS